MSERSYITKSVFPHCGCLTYVLISFNYPDLLILSCQRRSQVFPIPSRLNGISIKRPGTSSTACVGCEGHIMLSAPSRVCIFLSSIFHIGGIFSTPCGIIYHLGCIWSGTYFSIVSLTGAASPFQALRMCPTFLWSFHGPGDGAPLTQISTFQHRPHTSWDDPVDWCGELVGDVHYYPLYLGPQLAP